MASAMTCRKNGLVVLVLGRLVGERVVSGVRDAAAGWAGVWGVDVPRLAGLGLVFGHIFCCTTVYQGWCRLHIF